MVAALEADLRPRRILTRAAFENAIAVVMAVGGSTNAVLHLLAIAHEARVELTLADFDRVGRRVPHLVDSRPHGRFVMSEIDAAGGIPVVMRELLDAGLLDGDQLTVTGRTVAENLADLAPAAPDGTVVHALADPIHADGGIAVLHGSLAPDGAVVKVAGLDQMRFAGTARVFDGESGRDGLRPGPPTGARRRHRHPLRGAQGRAGHARDARGHRRGQGRRAAGTSRCSPTAGSPARPTACAWATWRPRPSTAGRSRWSPMATASSWTSTPAGSTWTSTPPSWSGGAWT